MTRSRGLRRLRGLLAALLATLTLAACVGLPRDSPVEQRLPVDAEATRRTVLSVPDPPVAGASPEEIAAGFLRAHIGVQDSYSVARQYLAGGASTRWRPEQGAVILASGNLSARRVAGAKVVVSAEAVAQMDGEGHVTELPDVQRRSVQLEMGQDSAGQWRVTGVPGDLGVWLSRSEFTRMFQPKRVYFPADNGAHVLVPDVRWFPEDSQRTSDPAMATALARAVLGPPPRWLSDVVRHRWPAGTRLDPASVSISATDRTATVTLSRAALAASPPARRALWASMLHTLSQASGVARVQLMVGSGRLQAEGVEDSPSIESFGFSNVQGPIGPVIVRQGGRLEWRRATPRSDRKSAPSSTDQRRLPVVGTEWFHLAADTQGREIAGVAGDRRSLGRWIGGRLVSRPPFGNALTRPAYDGQNGLWVAGEALADTGPAAGPPLGPPGTGGTPTIWVVDTRQPEAQAQPQPVAAPWLGQRDVLALAVSPEGQRLALVVRERASGRTALLLSGIVRSPSGDVDSLATPQVVDAALGGLASVSWVDEVTLGVLGQTGRSDGVQPITVPLGGFAEPLGVVPGAADVVGSSIPQDRLFVLTDRGSVLAREGRSWEVFDRAEDVITPAP